MSYTYDQIMNRLQSGVATVTFTKVDGSKRVMQCTLESSFLPEEYRNRGGVLTETVGNNISVWDVQANGWRSFRVDSVISID